MRRSPVVSPSSVVWCEKSEPVFSTNWSFGWPQTTQTVACASYQALECNVVAFSSHYIELLFGDGWKALLEGWSVTSNQYGLNKSHRLLLHWVCRSRVPGIGGSSKQSSIWSGPSREEILAVFVTFLAKVPISVVTAFDVFQVEGQCNFWVMVEKCDVMPVGKFTKVNYEMIQSVLGIMVIPCPLVVWWSNLMTNCPQSSERSMNSMCIVLIGVASELGVQFGHCSVTKCERAILRKTWRVW